ncbi:MAG: prolyl oligopeptidase family serine peptidase, partial [Terrimicrobiaceae bacterium]
DDSLAMTTAPYGSWRSPITADLIVAETVELAEAWLDGDDVYWCEGRPKESGRYVVVRYGAHGPSEDVTPPSFDARTRVHEYGGAAVLIREGTVYFANFTDQKLYRQAVGESPQAISRTAGCRYADAVFDDVRRRLILVREDHRVSESQPANTVTAVAIDGSSEVVLLEGNDFYSNPRLSPDGRKLAWLTWNHPHMPWVSTELWVGELDTAGHVASRRRIAGSETESLFQPEWSPEGILHFVSDRTGWWNLYRERSGQIEALFSKEADFGQPLWNLGASTYALSGGGRIVCSYREAGKTRIALLDRAGDRRELNLPFTEVSNLRASNGSILLCGGAPNEPACIARVTLDPLQCEVLRKASAVTESPELRSCLSTPSLFEFPTANDGAAFLWYYAPHNPAFTAPSRELPPLLVKSHGGPTAAASTTLDLEIQFWTSRGFAVADVDYGGSSGYGRAYRERLCTRWGIVDVEDCTNAAKYLAQKNLADPARAAITGGSAGGYTTLCALTFGDYFKIGASRYGVCDLEKLAADTHKFESHYLDWLVGKYPEDRQIYIDRSPIHAADRLNVPVILFQGEEDKIVPPNQAELIAASIRAKGLPLGYFLFAREQHGFRVAENIKRALEAELYFYSFLLVRGGLRF